MLKISNRIVIVNTLKTMMSIPLDGLSLGSGEQSVRSFLKLPRHLAQSLINSAASSSEAHQHARGRGGSIGRVSGLEIQWIPSSEVRIPSGAQEKIVRVVQSQNVVQTRCRCAPPLCIYARIRTCAR